MKNINILKILLPVTLSLAAVIIFQRPELGEWLQYDRSRIAGGEFLQILTCHWTHWTASHLFWDALTFAILGATCCHRNFKTFCLLVPGASLVISATVWLGCPALHYYRGLSGIDSALYCWTALSLLGSAISKHNHQLTTAYIVLLTAILGKTCYECFSGGLLFANPAGFTPVPLAHLAGITCGTVVYLLELIKIKLKAPVKINN